ncbi:ABC transporter permease [Streptomyces yaizuensis]|uniref:ABC-2 family transporter protein n=1 Tax=Streptomyces yaizuensis TaxID=2989713 RepID=A0ABQ5NRG0_9ACTN|nr:ABC-2 family transporter protein [Streptomyces sp. YSPA8]GLF92631.1 ABC-2 family transporter protein [Streptomyces sp. YSPA8]
MTATAPGLRRIAAARMRTALTYRQNVLLLQVIVILNIFILSRLWTTLFEGRQTVDGMTLHAFLLYLTVVNLQSWIFTDFTVSQYVYERVRTGEVVFDLMRPIGFIPQLLAHMAGSHLFMALSVVVALPVVMVVGTLAAPASTAALALYLPALLCGYVISVLMAVLLSMVAFWTVETSGFTVLYRLINQFFAGTMLPVSLFPEPLRILAALLPFQSTGYVPAAIYVGRIEGGEALRALAFQGVWILVLTLAAAAVWHRGRRRIAVQGG